MPIESLNLLDALDEDLMRQSGKVLRAADQQMCHHGDKGMCHYCQPLEAYDASLYQAPSISVAGAASNKSVFKHMSFHSWLRKRAIDKRGVLDGYLIPGSVDLIDEPRYKVNGNCKKHAAKGQCTLCTVPPITLATQAYRMIDHVAFADKEGTIVESVVREWRQSGLQVYGILLGSYDKMAEEEGTQWEATRVAPPLGIQAVIEGVYIPQQDGFADGFEIREEEMQRKLYALFEESVSYFGLAIVGQIYTDLKAVESEAVGPSDTTIATVGRVQNLRSKNSFFVSCYESQFMATMQNKFPYNCPWIQPTLTPAATYDSRFVTVILTGNEDCCIEPRAYQLSRQGSQLFQHGLITPSTDPRLLYRSPTAPDMFYNDSKGLISAESTFPVDYLLVNLTVGFQKDAKPTFHPNAATFPLNRLFISCEGNAMHPNFLAALAKHFQPLISQHEFIKAESSLLNLFSDLCIFMALVALQHVNLFFSKEDLSQLATLIRKKPSCSSSMPSLTSFLTCNASFQSFLAALAALDTRTQSGTWTCQFCTFLNATSSSTEQTCEMCGLPAQ
jgi:nuclear protein localization protein 4 homolog